METLKIMPVTPVGAVGKCMGSPQSYSDRLKGSYSYRDPSPDRVAAYALEQLEAARAADIAAHEANAPAIENNMAITERVNALMAEIGMPAKYSERDQHSRARYPKTITRPAGYLTDLLRECKTSDGFSAATSTYESLKQRYEAYAVTAQEETARIAQRAEQEKRAQADRRKADMELAAILLRYELPIDSTWDDVLENLRSRDQRLDLAVAMSQTRGDWFEGAYRVTSAISRFTIRTDEDKDIANDVLGCTHDFEDGRVFRDTAWNYDRLFASVDDKQLVADVQAAMQRAAA